MSVLGLGLLSPIAVHALKSPPAQGSSHRPSLVVPTASGKVKGQAGTGYDAWLGIPYATTAADRWTVPRPAASWTGVRDATRFGDRCAQPSGWDPGYEKAITTEDCLGLNVYAPQGSSADAPVVVWIHGGGFFGGAGQDTNPRNFVQQTGAVVVTVNYRLGPLGYLNLPELRAENANGAGNYGLLDQQAALRWVRSNIGHFGGDAGDVTIAGQSAGGSSVCDQLASPTAKGLFAHAVIMSGGCALQSAAAGETQSRAFVQEIGCATAPDVLACLRAKPATAILAAQLKAPVRPSLGGTAFPLDPGTAVRTGNFTRVPVMLGQTNSERGLFTFQNYDYLGTPMTADQYTRSVKSTYGTNADKVLAEYPLTAYPSPGQAWTAVQNGSTSYDRQQLMARLSRWVPTYAYEFAESDTPHFTSIFRLQQQSATARDFPFGGAIHVDDLGYLWDYLGQTLPYDDDQLELSHQMITFWGHFTATGDPNGSGTPNWPKYRTGTGELMSLKACDTAPSSDAPPAACSRSTRGFAEEHDLDFWGSLGAP
ncbi:carboxylesterase family protein [Streptomyces sp. MBT53]|uniref:carboxylesterase/lipase family protein n=1 Tax=Streptomyces sp. MBT53 TaxID=1488384 RepID=UPI0027DA99AC|nr:carboxylesterase family protein [Streptomyces sp. MBT53]